jgi:hypothetical protein
MIALPKQGSDRYRLLALIVCKFALLSGLSIQWAQLGSELRWFQEVVCKKFS